MTQGSNPLNVQGFISTKVAAKLTGYTCDYVGQLCRLGEVECQMIGRVWLINERSILEYQKKFLRTPLESTKKNNSYFNNLGIRDKLTVQDNLALLEDDHKDNSKNVLDAQEQKPLVYPAESFAKSKLVSAGAFFVIGAVMLSVFYVFAGTTLVSQFAKENISPRLISSTKVTEDFFYKAKDTFGALGQTFKNLSIQGGSRICLAIEGTSDVLTSTYKDFVENLSNDFSVIGSVTKSSALGTISAGNDLGTLASASIIRGGRLFTDSVLGVARTSATFSASFRGSVSASAVTA